MSFFTKAWIGWILSFFGIEGYALWKDRHGSTGCTLSEHFRKWFATDTMHGRQIWLAVFGIFSAWFTCHIAVKGSTFEHHVKNLLGKD